MTFNPTQPRENDGRFGTVHRGDPGQLDLDDTISGLMEAATSALDGRQYDRVETELVPGGRPRVRVVGALGVSAAERHHIRTRIGSVSGAVVSFPGRVEPDVERVLHSTMEKLSGLESVRSNPFIDDQPREFIEGQMSGLRNRAAAVAAPTDRDARHALSRSLMDGELHPGEWMGELRSRSEGYDLDAGVYGDVALESIGNAMQCAEAAYRGEATQFHAGAYSSETKNAALFAAGFGPKTETARQFICDSIESGASRPSDVLVRLRQHLEESPGAGTT